MGVIEKPDLRVVLLDYVNTLYATHGDVELENFLILVLDPLLQEKEKRNSKV